MKISDASHSPENLVPVLHSNSPPDLTPQVRHDPNFHRRRLRKSILAGSLVRRSRNEFPVTPLRGWKFQERNDLAGVMAAGRRCSRRVRGNEQMISVSARKLAAGLWQLTAEVTINGGGGGGGSSQCDRFDSLGLEPAAGGMRFPFDLNSRDCGAKISSWLKSPLSYQRPKHKARVKHKSSLSFSKFPLEGATKWDQGYTNISTGSYHHISDAQNLKLQEVAVVPVVSVLQAKLEWARARIKELKAEHWSCKKEVLLFLRKLGEEKTSWMRREHQKLHAIIDNLKHELKRERSSSQRVQIVNSKLLKDIAKAKLAAKGIMQNYEKERKARELMEEVCHELAKKIEEDKIEMDELKRESLKIREQVEEERKMLQMAEVWREERVQIKLVDAKLILEEKYCQMNNLIADLEVFLRSRDESLDMIEMSEAEVIRQAVKSVDIQEMKDILCSTIEDLQNDVARNRESVQSVNYSCVGYGSEIKSNPVRKPFNGYTDDGGVLEGTGGLETVTHNEDEGSSYTSEGSNCTIDRKGVERTISSVLGASCISSSCLTGHESLKSEISDMCSALAKQLKKKPSIVSRQLKSSRGDSNANKIISVEGSGRFANGLTSKMGKMTPAGTLVEGGACHDMVGKWNSRDLGNPHITRGMKGCIVWPQGIPKNGLKAKLFDSRYKGKRPENLVV